MDGISLFAQRYIRGLRPGNITGPDRRYGNWAVDLITNSPNAYNSVPRATDRAGAAALGKGPSDPAPPNGVSESGITYDPTPTESAQKAGTASPQRYGLRDVDKSSNLANVADSKKFSTNTWAPSSQPTDTVTFPFETGNVTEDNDTIAALKARAQGQGRYIQRPSGGSFTITEGTGPENYPRNSDLGTVMFIEFAGGTKGSVEYKARTASGDNLVKGTIVVVNGDLSTNSSADDFQGAFVVRDGDTTRIGGVEPVMEYRNPGSINLQGFLNVEGDIFLKGNVDGLLPGSLVSGIDGLYSLTLWSWRECYDLNCG